MRAHSYLLIGYLLISYVAGEYACLAKSRLRTTLSWMATPLRRCRDAVRPLQPWSVPGKEEICVEWLREIHGTRDWCVKAAQ